MPDRPERPRYWRLIESATDWTRGNAPDFQQEQARTYWVMKVVAGFMLLGCALAWWLLSE